MLLSGAEMQMRPGPETVIARRGTLGIVAVEESTVLHTALVRATDLSRVVATRLIQSKKLI